MTAALALNLPDAGGVTSREHAAQLARQTGRTFEAALAAMGLENPVIPPDGEQLWGWFWELAGARAHNGFAPQPLSWIEINAWAHLTATPLTPGLVTMLRNMDSAWLAAHAKQNRHTATTKR